MLLAALVAGVLPQPNDTKIGEAIGRDMPWLLGFGALLSFGVQTRTRWMIAVGGLVTVVGVFGPAVVLATIALRAQPKLNVAEHGPLKFDQGMACHPVLPLTFGPIGGQLLDDPEMESKLAPKLDTAWVAVWSWKKPTNERVILYYFRGLSAKADAFQQFVAGFRDGFTRSSGLKVDRESQSTDAMPFRYELLGTLPNRAAFGAACRSLDEGPGIRGIACIQTFASSNADLADLRASLVDKRCSP